MNQTTSFLGGAQVGGNYEFGNGVLVGVEADFDWAANSGNTSTATASGYTVTANDRWFTILDGRLGYAWDRFLVYGKAGGAWVGSNNPAISGPAGSLTVSTSNNNWGWTAGAGVEWAFWGNLSARLEYDYIGLTNQTFTVTSVLGAIPVGDQFTGSGRSIQMVNLGLNYKFGW